MIKKLEQWMKGGLWCGLLVAIILTSVRGLGGFVGMELKAFDLAFQSRPKEPRDSRIVIVGITYEDLEFLQSSQISDEVLAKLISKIQTYNPRVIGLDLIRDFPVGSGSDQLDKVLRDSDNVIGATKKTYQPGDNFFKPIKALDSLEQNNQVGDISVIVDDDGVVRRGNLYPITGEETVTSFSLKLAFSYLEKEGIFPESAPSGELQLSQIVFRRFQSNDGGYVRADDSGYQILLNWRSPPQNFQQFSVKEVLSGTLLPEFFNDKIVLLGAYDQTLKDEFMTPFSRWKGKTPKPIYGVTLHANNLSQILGAVLDNRPLLTTANQFFDFFWLWGWCLISSSIVWKFSETSLKRQIFVSGSWAIVAGFGLIFVYLLSFWGGFWIPIISALIAINSSIVISFLATLGTKIYKYQHHLETLVKERTAQLEKTQKQLVEQEKLAFLGRLSGGLAHELANPLYGIQGNLAILTLDFPDNVHLSQIQKEFSRLAVTLDFVIDNLRFAKNQGTESRLKNLEEVVNNALNLVFLYKGNRNRFSKDKIIVELNEKTKNEKIPSQLEFILINLIDNSIFSVTEKKTIKEDFEPYIIVKAITKKRGIILIVEDNGLGLDPEIKANLFTPFLTNKPAPIGLGLGLYTCKNILDDLGFLIQVESQKDEYCKFVIHLRIPDNKVSPKTQDY
ncbi:MAG: CHASE2 domain-containing protein [Crocosphaera sp.]